MAPALRLAVADVVRKVQFSVNHLVRSAGASVASLMLGSMLTLHTQTRNFLAAAGNVFAAPAPLPLHLLLQSNSEAALPTPLSIFQRGRPRSMLRWKRP